MGRLLRSYAALIRMGLVESAAYRAQLIIGLLLALVPFIMMAVWLAVVDQVDPASGWEKADFVSYYVGVAAVYQVTISYLVWEWQREIQSGDFSVRLLKPLDPFHFYVSRNLGRKLFDLVLIAPVLLLALLLIRDLRFQLDPLRIVALTISLFGAFMLSTLMNTVFGMIAFWTTQSVNLYALWYGIGQFLSGWLAPLALFPDWFSQPAYLLPFHSTLGFPVEILVGQVEGWGIVNGLLLSLFWNVVFAVVYRLLWRRGRARYEAVGS